MRNIKRISWFVLATGALLLLLHWWFLPLLDWIVRVTGVLTLAALCLVVFFSVKTRNKP
ncbi:hypothetical protein [Anaeromassilibacillus senegalensis]|uniref:hypothetical protein n=1 Tax=Anaeromassilibacillus senegalensis TaxID=1673717 RepID=UPI0012B66BDB|nr:hypothetical protein [Anaeromassilibacillus senegalensis]